MWSIYIHETGDDILCILLRYHFPVNRRVYKERLGLPMKMTIGYQSHSDTATKSGSTTKNKFVVWEMPYVPLSFPCLICCWCIMFTLLQRLCGIQSGRQTSPRLHARCFHNLSRTWTTGKKNPMENRKSSFTLTIRGINIGGDLEYCILY